MSLTSKYKHDIGTTAASHSHLKSLLGKGPEMENIIVQLNSVSGYHRPLQILPHVFRISDKLSQECATPDNPELKGYTPTLPSIFFLNNHYQLCNFCFCF